MKAIIEDAFMCVYVGVNRLYEILQGRNGTYMYACMCPFTHIHTPTALRKEQNNIY
jgi:hypothetical protein